MQNQFIIDFFMQPFGAVGALFIMLAVTCFNSRKLQKALSTRVSGESLALILNCLNFIGGSLLLINAALRDEAVWIVLEVYFILICLKGILQNIAQVRKHRNDPGGPAAGPSMARDMMRSA